MIRLGPPVSERIQGTVPAAAAGDAQNQVIAESHVSGKVIGVSFVPEAAVTAHGTNYRTLRVVNKGSAGAGTAVIASFALDTPTTDDLVAFDEKSIPLSSTEEDLVVAVGDVLIWDETVAAAGVASPGGRVEIEISRT